MARAELLMSVESFVGLLLALDPGATVNHFGDTGDYLSVQLSDGRTWVISRSEMAETDFNKWLMDILWEANKTVTKEVKQQIKEALNG